MFENECNIDMEAGTLDAMHAAAAELFELAWIDADIKAAAAGELRYARRVAGSEKQWPLAVVAIGWCDAINTGWFECELFLEAI